MNKNSKYIDLYNRFESAVKKSGFSSIKAYEESFADDQFKQEQIKICRLIRNYIEYESPSFVEASDNMMNFLEKEIMRLDEGDTPVKYKMIPIKYAIRDTDLIIVAADFMIKRKQSMIPVFNNDDFAIGAIEYKDIVKLLASGDFTKAKKVAIIQNNHKFGFVNEMTPMKQVLKIVEDHKKIYLVLNDSKKVVGWID